MVGGVFSTAGDVPVRNIAQWSVLAAAETGDAAAAWTTLGAETPLGAGEVMSLAIYKDRLVVGGRFATAGLTAVNSIAQFDGTAWSGFGIGIRDAFDVLGEVRALSVVGNDLIAGGDFTLAGSVAASNIAAWDGAAWRALGTGANGAINALAEYNGQLVVGGDFNLVGGIVTADIAQWDGTVWSAVGGGIDSTISSVDALVAYKNVLIIGGNFDAVGGVTAIGVAQWDGTAWSTLGTGLGLPAGTPFVYALALYNNNVLAAGRFTTAGDVTSNCIAVWDGAAWSGLGTGIGGEVHALAVTPANTIYAGGDFETATGVATNGLALWNGTAWTSLGFVGVYDADRDVNALLLTTAFVPEEQEGESGTAAPFETWVYIVAIAGILLVNALITYFIARSVSRKAKASDDEERAPLVKGGLN